MCDGDDDCQDDSDEDPKHCGGYRDSYKVSHVRLFDFVPIYLAIDDQVILSLQRELSVMASSAPITPASPPPHTATAFRSVQTALTSTTVVSEPVCLEESKAFISCTVKLILLQQEGFLKLRESP